VSSSSSSSRARRGLAQSIAHVSTTTDGDIDALALSTARITRAVRQWARVEQVKRGILSQLGLEQAPIDRNGTAEEENHTMGGDVMTTYRRCMQQIAEQSSDAARSDGNDVTYSDDASDDVEETESHHTQARKFDSYTSRPGKPCHGVFTSSSARNYYQLFTGLHNNQPSR